MSADLAGNLTGYSHGFEFGASATGVSFGRHLLGTGEEEFVLQSSSSLGQANAGPRIGPVVLTEIHYHPEPGEEEFVELKNLTANPVDLFEGTNGWRLSGLGYELPVGVTLGARRYLLLVGIEPAAFRARYGVDPGVLILGPYTGKLQDSGEKLELERPVAGTTVYEVVDRVRYNDKAPWPVAADGSGPSLQKIEAGLYGNEPMNWTAARATPGGAYEAGVTPVILSGPAKQTVVASEEARFEVMAEGPGVLEYQWRWNGEGLEGETNASLRLMKVRPEQAGFYSVVVYNGGGAVVSGEAELVVLIPARITQQPQSRGVRPGASATFSVTAVSTTPIRYQWRRNGQELTGATGSSLTITNAQVVDEGVYSVVVRDGVGAVESEGAGLTILFNPVFVEQPESQVAVVGERVSFRVNVSGTEPKGYRWRRNGNTVVPFSLGSAALVLTNVQLAQAGSYSVLATNAALPAGVVSASATLTVLADTDHDRMPDEWETAHGLNPNDGLDGAVDSDGDGLKNWEEYQAGTDPRDPKSYLKVERLGSGAGGGMELEFLAVSNKTYSVEYREGLGSGWKSLAEVSARETNRVERVEDPAVGLWARFYRLVTPRRR